MKLKMVLAAAILVSAGVAKADSTILTCSTGGDALDSVLVKSMSNGKGVVEIQVSESDEGTKPVSYAITMGLNDLSTGTSATIIAQAHGAEQFGGGTSKSILLRVLDGQKSAILAMDGTVYRLLCNK